MSNPRSSPESAPITGTLHFTVEPLGASYVVRDRLRGEVMCFRPDLATALQATVLLESSGQYLPPAHAKTDL
jgi:hypothetical protein